jgi:plasmid stabilization system protein ParE
MLDYEFHPEAFVEFKQVVTYYLQQADADVANSFRNEFFASLQKCQTSPLLYGTFYKDVRRIILHKPFGEYYLPFVLLNDRIYVLAVAHAKRKPLYWRKRLKDAQ